MVSSTTTNQRAQAAQIIYQVINDRRSLNDVLSEQESGLVKNLCYGSLRWYFRLEAMANQLLNSPLRKKDYDVFCLILIGLYQIYYLNTPEYAAVAESVDATKGLKKSWAHGLVNKILRRAIAEKETLLESIPKSEPGHFAHPAWLIEQLKSSWPNDWQNILNANNTHPPLFLRVNLQLISRDDYVKQLHEANIEAKIISQIPTAIHLPNPIPVSEIPGFQQGLCSVQDVASQQVASILDLAPDQYILDACAAPGGKSSLILETEPNIARLVAIDKDTNRLIKIKENITRLKLNPQLVQLKLEDASHTDHWWDGELFDRILLDAPCSGTGVVRRHPDIKLLRQPEDLNPLSQEQLKLLTRLWPLLKKGGKLIYTTCSVLPIENNTVIKTFCDASPKAKVTPLNIHFGQPQSHGYQLFPQDSGPDGFFYSQIIKI